MNKPQEYEEKWGVFYRLYDWGPSFDTYDEAKEYAKKLEQDEEILEDYSQRDLHLHGPVSQYITVHDISHEFPIYEDEDEHIGCFSYPNCDIDPLGCSVKMGDRVEAYGHKE